MKKKLVSVIAVLFAVCMLSSCACGTKQEAAQPTAAAVTSIPEADMQNPVIEYTTYAELMQAAPAINMADAPVGSTNVKYSVISDGAVAPIAQIDFTLGGHNYCYRAAGCQSEASMQDISGVYSSFSNKSVVPATENGVTYGQMTVSENTGAAKGLVSWFYPYTLCQYTLYSETANDASKTLQNVAASLLAIKNDKNGNPLPITQSGNTVSGTVVSASEKLVTVKLTNGNTVSFTLNLAVPTTVIPGDEVTVTYTGDALTSMVATNIVVVKRTAQVISGEVVQVLSGSFFIKVADGSIYGMNTDSKTTVTGDSDEVTKGAQVNVYYTGDIDSQPVALSIVILEEGEDEDPTPTYDPSLIDKSLTGYVYKLSRSRISVVTTKGRRYSFYRTGSTEYYGSYTLQVGCQVMVVYDGYASKCPDAKVIKTLSDPIPIPTATPKPSSAPYYYTTSGTVTDFGGMALTLDNGMTFDVAYAKHTGNGNHEVGDRATVTYWVDDGCNYAYSIDWEMKVYSKVTEAPTEAPAATQKPTAEPTAEPTPAPTAEPTPAKDGQKN